MIRLAAFIGILLLMIAWELYAPRRKLILSRWQRWIPNLSLSIFNMLLIRFTVGGIAYLSALSASTHGLGVLNYWALPHWLTIFVTLLLLDLSIYGQHIALHRWAWLWQLHKVHHTDLEFDVTTAVRFHPVEIILSMAYKVLCIVIIGANPDAVIAFEVILSSCALFNHSNIYIPVTIDKWLRLFIVTPDMHRIHHSSIKSETNSNYGFSVSWWDRLFTTYTNEPIYGHKNMEIGLPEYREIKKLNIKELILIPFQPRHDV